jgi:hypothetical protein
LSSISKINAAKLAQFVKTVVKKFTQIELRLRLTTASRHSKSNLLWPEQKSKPMKICSNQDKLAELLEDQGQLMDNTQFL